MDKKRVRSSNSSSRLLQIDVLNGVLFMLKVYEKKQCYDFGGQQKSPMVLTNGQKTQNENATDTYVSLSLSYSNDNDESIKTWRHEDMDILEAKKPWWYASNHQILVLKCWVPP
jgi:hypothetical protein